MNDANAEYLVLLDVATREAERFLSRRTPDCDPEDLGQKAVIEFWRWREKNPDVKVENAKALVKRMTRSVCLAAVKKARRRKRLDAQKPLPVEQRSSAEEYEDIEEAIGLLVRLQVQNDIQRGIVSHQLRGIDIWLERDDVLWCMCVTSQKMAKETHNLQGVGFGESVIEAGPKCDCHARRYFRWLGEMTNDLLRRLYAMEGETKYECLEYDILIELLRLMAIVLLDDLMPLLMRRGEVSPRAVGTLNRLSRDAGIALVHNSLVSALIAPPKAN